MFLIGLILFITLGSGLYPAIVTSRFKPTAIFRDFAGKGKKTLSAVFLTFQMTLAMITIVAAVMFVHTNRINEARDWRYDQYNKLNVSI